MAIKEQEKRLLAGAEEWNAWRDGKGRGVEVELVDVDLSNADLSGVNLNGANLERATLQGANLDGASLRNSNLGGVKLDSAHLIGADLFRAYLNSASLRGANLRSAALINTTLINASLRGADLSRTNLTATNLTNTNLSHADLGHAHLFYANLNGANLSHANLKGGRLRAGSLGNLDLSGALGLADVKHHGSSTVGADTLGLTAQGLVTAPPGRQGEVETLLRGAGVEEHYLEMFRSRIGMPIEFYSAFISYSHADKPFARRLYNDLQAQGIRCWLDEHNMLPGDRILDVVNQAIRSTDRVLLCCSLASLTSPWVEDEIAMTFEKEREGQENVLIPLDLDGYLFDGWKSGSGARVRSRVAARFEGWDTDAGLYEERLERVVEAMRPRGVQDGK